MPAATTNHGMHTRLREVITIAEETRRELLAVLDALRAEQWSAAAPSGGWTVAQIVAHLQMVESSSLRALFRTLRDGVKAGTARAEDSTESVADAMESYIAGPASGPMVAPAFIVPPGDVNPQEELIKLADARAGLRTWAAEADGIALGGLTFPHPIMGPLNLYQWVLFLALHERRHLSQIQRILHDTAGPSAGAS